MIIPIKCNSHVEEWAIIELQGDISQSSEDTNNHTIGDLHFTKSGTPILIIGIHVLHGKEITLAKPIAVLQKKRNTETVQDDSNTQVEYVIKALVQKKLVFKMRPRPIIMGSLNTV